MRVILHPWGGILTVKMVESRQQKQFQGDLYGKENNLDTAEVGLFKYAIVHSAEYSFGLTTVLLGGILPLVLLPGDA